MCDFLTAGFAALRRVFKRAANSGVIVHCHRAMHAVFTRQKNHGIHMRVVAKWLRLAGGDHLHTGTVVGKLEGSSQRDAGRSSTCCASGSRPANPARGAVLRAGLAGLKTVWPVASGGIHVLNIPDLYKIYGNDAFWLFGGGHARPSQRQPGGGARQPRGDRSGGRRPHARAGGEGMPGAARRDGALGQRHVRGLTEGVSMPFRAGRPIMLCLVGDSGAGKSTLSGGCVALLGAERVTDVCLDDYHSLDRAERLERHITALHPDANHLALMGQHVRLLRQGETIFKPVYDHSDGKFGQPEFVTPRPIVLVHGLHGLYTGELRRQWDVSVFLDPDPELRIEWKIKRDTSKRGYTREEVIQQLEQRRHDSETYIRPQREQADIVISFSPPSDYAQTKDDARLNVRIVLRHPIPLPDLEDVLAVAQGGKRPRGDLVLQRGAEGVDLLDIHGGISDAATGTIEARMWDHMSAARHLRSDRLGVFQDGAARRRSNPLAVTQLVLTYYLVKASALARKQEQRREHASIGAGDAGR